MCKHSFSILLLIAISVGQVISRRSIYDASEDSDESGLRCRCKGGQFRGCTKISDGKTIFDMPMIQNDAADEEYDEQDDEGDEGETKTQIDNYKIQIKKKIESDKKISDFLMAERRKKFPEGMQFEQFSDEEKHPLSKTSMIKSVYSELDRELKRLNFCRTEEGEDFEGSDDDDDDSDE